jgi:MoaA/NifB/PqqE/SkfB family radical SAM enzyme
LVDDCNYRCMWCRSHSHLLPEPVPPRTLPRRLFEELIEDLQGLGTRLVEISGRGEPLLHPEFRPMLRSAKQRGLELLLITNGSLLTEELCAEIVELGVDTLNVSLNAADAETHERVHRAPRGDYHRLLRLLHDLSQAKARRADGKPFLSISFVVEKEHYRQIPHFTQQMLAVGADHLFFAPMGVNCASGDFALTHAQDEEARGLVAEADRALRARGRRSNAWHYLDRPTETYWTKDLFCGGLPCYIGQVYGRVLATGDVYPCGPATDRIFGNLATARYRDIWHSAAYREFRREALAMPHRRERVQGCLCWTCGHHFLHKQYAQSLYRGEVQPRPLKAGLALLRARTML